MDLFLNVLGHKKCYMLAFQQQPQDYAALKKKKKSEFEFSFSN